MNRRKSEEGHREFIYGGAALEAWRQKRGILGIFVPVLNLNKRQTQDQIRNKELRCLYFILASLTSCLH